MTKLAVLAAITLTAFAVEGVWAIGLFAALGIPAFGLRKVLCGGVFGSVVFQKKLLLIIPLAFPMFWLMAGDVGTGAWMAAVFLCRLGVLVLSALIFVGVTGQDQLIRGLVQARLPVELAMMMTVAIRFAPVLLQELKDILNAQRARCYRIRPGNLQALAIPAVLLLLKRSHDVSLAMWTKGYRGKWNSGGIRLEFRLQDIILLFFAAIMGGLAVFA